MSQTSGDSKKYDMVCISFGKENQKGIEVTKAGKKDSFLEQTMEIQAVPCDLGEVVNFENYKKIAENNQKRLTAHALEMAEKRGNKAEILNYNLERAKIEGKANKTRKAQIAR